MARNIVIRLIAGLLLLAAIAGIAFLAYQAGANHGSIVTAQAPASGNPQVYFPFIWFPFYGLGGLFGLLFGLFLLAIAFGAMRRMIFGPMWGWRHMQRSEWRHGRFGGEGIPPMFEEWHRRAHANMSGDGDQKPGA